MLSNASALARPKSGGALECAGKHFWALIFLVLFASRQKVHNKKCACPDRSIGEHRCLMRSASGANQIQCVSFIQHQNAFEKSNSAGKKACVLRALG
jgi:hypothetical protein